MPSFETALAVRHDNTARAVWLFFMQKAATDVSVSRTVTVARSFRRDVKYVGLQHRANNCCPLLDRGRFAEPTGVCWTCHQRHRIDPPRRRSRLPALVADCIGPCYNITTPLFGDGPALEAWAYVLIYYPPDPFDPNPGPPVPVEGCGILSWCAQTNPPRTAAACASDYYSGSSSVSSACLEGFTTVCTVCRSAACASCLQSADGSAACTSCTDPGYAVDSSGNCAPAGGRILLCVLVSSPWADCARVLQHLADRLHTHACSAAHLIPMPKSICLFMDPQRCGRAVKAASCRLFSGSMLLIVPVDMASDLL